VALVQTIAVIGAGTMGRGIAHAAALGGYRTILEDLLPAALRKAETEIRANLDKAVELGKVAASDADSAFRRLEYAGSVEEAARPISSSKLSPKSWNPKSRFLLSSIKSAVRLQFSPPILLP